MAAGKIFAISFAIGAVMNATFGSAMNRGSAALQQLSERTRFLNSEQRRLDRAWQQSQAQIQSYAAHRCSDCVSSTSKGASPKVSTGQDWRVHSRGCVLQE